MSGLLEFIEAGSATITGAGLWSLSKADATGARLYLSRGTSGYRITHDNGSTAVNSEAAAFPALGQLVSLRWQLAADGSVTLWQKLDAGSEVAASASAANTLAGAWGARRIFLNGVGKTNLGYLEARKYGVGGGALTLAQLVALIG